jgi:hypothetical protein
MQKLSLVAAVLSAALGACAGDDSSPDTIDPSTTTFTVKIENVAPWIALKSAQQTTKVDGTSGPAGPGAAFEIRLTAGKRQKLSFAAMFGQSNDWFFAPGPDGIALYNADGTPRSGDVTSEVSLWNAGTEIDQEPAVGDATGPKQPSPDFGAPDPDPTVRAIGSVATLSDGGTFSVPAIADMMKVTLTPAGGGVFTLRIENVSTATTLVTSAGTSGIGISPPVWALHTGSAPLFEPGTADRSLGLELVAESGRGADLTGSLRALTGVATPISPGVFAVHQGSEPFYALGLPDLGLGLEHLAEDGNPAPLRDAMLANAAGMQLATAGGFDTPIGADAAGPARPGQAFEFEVTASPGDHLSLATMFGFSNDWVFATRPDGIALFDGDLPRTGDVTDAIAIFDVGTEVDQELAIGIDTAPQQAAPDTGSRDPVDQVREVPSSVHPVPASGHLRVTLTPQ